jgi:hypothetical protein
MEIDDKTFGKGFDCFATNAICNLGVADWHGREAIRENLRAFIDTGFTAHHDIVEYRDGGSLKVFRGIVTMIPDDKSGPRCPTFSIWTRKTQPRSVDGSELSAPRHFLDVGAETLRRWPTKTME